MTIKDSILGIDVGSVAAGIVLIDHDRRIVHEGYAFHHGDIRATLGKLLQGLDLTRIEQCVATASTPLSIRAAQRYKNEICFTTAAKHAYLQMGALLFVGGEIFASGRQPEKNIITRLCSSPSQTTRILPVRNNIQPDDPPRSPRLRSPGRGPCRRAAAGHPSGHRHRLNQHQSGAHE